MSAAVSTVSYCTVRYPCVNVSGFSLLHNTTVATAEQVAKLFPDPGLNLRALGYLAGVFFACCLVSIIWMIFACTGCTQYCTVDVERMAEEDKASLEAWKAMDVENISRLESLMLWDNDKKSRAATKADMEAISQERAYKRMRLAFLKAEENETNEATLMQIRFFFGLGFVRDCFMYLRRSNEVLAIIFHLPYHPISRAKWALKLSLMLVFAFVISLRAGFQNRYGHLLAARRFPNQIVESAGCIFDQDLGGNPYQFGVIPNRSTSCWCPLNSNTILASSGAFVKSADTQWRAGFLVCSCSSLDEEALRAAKKQPASRPGCKNLDNVAEVNQAVRAPQVFRRSVINAASQTSNSSESIVLIPRTKRGAQDPRPGWTRIEEQSIAQPFGVFSCAPTPCDNEAALQVC